MKKSVKKKVQPLRKCRYRNPRNGEILIIDTNSEIRVVDGERFVPAIAEDKIGTAAGSTHWYKESALEIVKK